MEELKIKSEPPQERTSNQQLVHHLPNLKFLP